MQSVAHTTRPPIPAFKSAAFGRPLQRFSVEQYHAMIDVGVFSHGEKCELIRGVILEKPVPKPPHAYAVDVLVDLLRELIGPNYIARAQQPITLDDSEPEPDLVVAIGTRQDYKARHPGPDDVELLVEVADSSLGDDRTSKLELYAEAGIGIYWIVNLVGRGLEVHTQPKGGKKPRYRKTVAYGRGDLVPVVIRGKKVGEITISDILP
jgi:Uma2 family endonuclease